MHPLRRSGRSRSARARTSGDRLRRCRRPGDKCGNALKALRRISLHSGRRCGRKAFSAARSRPEGGVPVHRPGLAVRQHAARRFAPPSRSCAETFAEADRIMTPLLGKPLSEFIFVDPTTREAVAKAEEDLRQTEITQPTVLTIDIGIDPAAGRLWHSARHDDGTQPRRVRRPGRVRCAVAFDDALEAVSARGRGMTQVAVDDNGRMAAVFAPLAEVERILKTINGYVVIANVNSNTQSVIGGASKAVEQAIADLPESRLQRGASCRSATPSTPRSWRRPANRCARCCSACICKSPRVPIVANVNGEFYPTGPDVRTADAGPAGPAGRFAGAVREGPAHALRRRRARLRRSRTEEGVAGIRRGCARQRRAMSFRCSPIIPRSATSRPSTRRCADCTRRGSGRCEATVDVPRFPPDPQRCRRSSLRPWIHQHQSCRKCLPWPVRCSRHHAVERRYATPRSATCSPMCSIAAWEIYRRQRSQRPQREPVVITGAALGLPGTEHIFDDGNIARLLRGDQFIDLIPASSVAPCSTSTSRAW